jgi:hypothetical protein
MSERKYDQVVFSAKPQFYDGWDGHSPPPVKFPGCVEGKSHLWETEEGMLGMNGGWEGGYITPHAFCSRCGAPNPHFSSPRETE